ncbi:YlaI family protein [Salsuginibacillus halophilus]|uniref:YlaI family protein n=1 Tax=Salsuginibacillus halophilus TaxID=517424 RepID=UPI000D0E1FA8|nr:YlaI family protein [Salsuginibacillus halophilus]
MKVKCSLCDKVETLDNQDPTAKKLRNRPIHTYMCSDCHERIKLRTEERHATGNFSLYRGRAENDDW